MNFMKLAGAAGAVGVGILSVAITVQVVSAAEPEAATSASEVVLSGVPAVAATGWGAAFASEIAHGDAHLAAQEFARAADCFERATRLAPHAYAGHYKAALALYKWGNAVPARRVDLWPAAIRLADRARFLDASSADAVFLAGVLRYRMGDYKSAADVYKSLEKVRQGDIDLYLDLAVAGWRGGDMRLATLALDRARMIDPASKRLHSVALEVLGSR
jgi:tetratricopeptide (TPR) repeat protein